MRIQKKSLPLFLIWPDFSSFSIDSYMHAYLKSKNYKCLIGYFVLRIMTINFLDSQMPRLFSLHFHIFWILHFHIFWILHFLIFWIILLLYFTFSHLLHVWTFVFFIFPFWVSFWVCLKYQWCNLLLFIYHLKKLTK